MTDRINIPITVTGAADAKEELRAVGQAAAEAKQAAAGGAGPGAPSVAEQTARGLGTAADKTALFTREGRTLAAVLLTQINPALGSMVMLISRVVAGFSAISLGMIGLVGASAALGGVVLMFQEWRAQAEAVEAAVRRAQAAMKAMREEGMDTRKRLADAGAAAGLMGATAAMQATAAELQHGGIPRELAENAALAEQIAAQQGIGFDRQRYLAGLATRGMQPAPFGMDQSENRRTLLRLLAAGQREDAQRAIEAYTADVGLGAAAEAPTADALRADPLDVAAKRLGAARGDFTAEELAAAERIAREILPEIQRRGGRRGEAAIAALSRRIVDVPWYVDIRRPLTDELALGARAGLGSARVEELIDAAETMLQDARKLGGGSAEARRPTSQPVNINITNHNNTHVATAYLPEGGGTSRSMYEALEGGGIVD